MRYNLMSQVTLDHIPRKNSSQIIREGFNAEGALVFLTDLFEKEEKILIDQLMCCDEKELPFRRQNLKYMRLLHRRMKEKVLLGIQYAEQEIEQPDNGFEGEN